MNYSEKWKIPLINASTETSVPKERKIEYVKVPNASLEMVTFLWSFPSFARALLDAKMSLDIVETHQTSKISKSGTARAIADKLGIPHAAIIDIRQKGIQRILSIPENILNKHASHFFTFVSKSGAVRIKVVTEVTDHATYAEGLLSIASKVLSEKERKRLSMGDNPVGMFL